MGLSDHSMSTYIAGAAVAIGASVIEKHVTLDQNGPSPDSSISININDFSKMVQIIRGVESAMGNKEKEIIHGLENFEAHQKSLIAKQDIKKGEILSENNVIAKRAAGGINAIFYDKLLGSVFNSHIKKDTLIQYNQLQ